MEDQSYWNNGKKAVAFVGKFCGLTRAKARGGRVKRGIMECWNDESTAKTAPIMLLG